MNLPRREFLKTSLAASALTALPAGLQAAEGNAGSGRDYYELRAYRLKPGASTARLDAYLESALIPALGQRGIKTVGAFTQIEVDKATGASKPMVDSPVWVLIPHSSLESFVNVSADLNADAAVQKAGQAYLGVGKDSPVFTRIDSWLLRAFAGMPRLELPAFSRDRVKTRVLEMRSYESFSESKALAKMAMFNDGEIGVMKDLGMSPIFFGQAISGRDLPHLTYATSAPDLATHLANWKKFSTHPGWLKIKDLPQYADTVSKNTPFFLVPAAYSQI
jgi:hypothetical protein